MRTGDGRPGRLVARRGVVAGVGLVLMALALPPAAADGPRGRGRVSHELDLKVSASAPDDLVSVIVQTNGAPSSGHMSRLHGRGGSVKSGHSSITGYSARIPASQIALLADDPEVDEISLDAPVTAALDIAVKAIKADVAYAASGGLDGAGVGIAFVDTGVAPHPDILRFRGSRQPIEVEVVGLDKGLVDPFGHGTLVAGILNGSGLLSSGPDAFRKFRGLAPGARLISIRALQPDGTGNTSDVITGIDWAITHKDEYRIRVLNLSLGHPVFESYVTDPLCRAARAAVDAGLVVVVSAGNGGRIGSGFGTITSPGNDPSVITVGAMDDGNTVALDDDVLAPYSAKGPTLIDYVVKPDLVAPGTRIVSLRAPRSYLDLTYHALTLRRSDYLSDPRGGNADGDYFEMSGTSLAAPMVAATAALMIQKEPGLTPATVKARLMKAAVKDGSMPFETGAGYLDVAAALQTGGDAAAAPSPIAVAQADGTLVIPGVAGTWGTAWSESLIWGLMKSFALTTTTVENNQVTASGLVWGGGGSLTGEGLVWGGGGSLTGEGLVWGGGGN